MSSETALSFIKKINLTAGDFLREDFFNFSALQHVCLEKFKLWFVLSYSFHAWVNKAMPFTVLELDFIAFIKHFRCKLKFKTASFATRMSLKFTSASIWKVKQTSFYLMFFKFWASNLDSKFKQNTLILVLRELKLLNCVSLYYFLLYI